MRSKSVSLPRMRETITPKSSMKNRERLTLRKPSLKTLSTSLKYFQSVSSFCIWYLTFSQAWTEKAAEFCERYENPRAADVVQRNLDSVQAALKEREKRYVRLFLQSLALLTSYSRRHGATVEEMTIEVNKTKATYETAITDLKNMGALNKVKLLDQFCLNSSYGEHVFPGAQVVIDYSSGQVARVPPSYRTSLQACLPIPSLKPWLLWKSLVRPQSRNPAA